MSRLNTLYELTDSYAYACSKVSKSLSMREVSDICRIAAGGYHCKWCILGKPFAGKSNLTITGILLQGTSE